MVPLSTKFELSCPQFSNWMFS